MAVTINEATKEITVEQADLTLVSGTLYAHDTEAFRTTINDLMDDERYIWMDDPIVRNAPVTVAGTTFAQTMEMINSYFLTYDDTPGAYSVRLEGSNNNFFDIQNGILTQNDVQVIPGNSAGLQTVNTSGTVAPTQQEIRDAMSMEHTSGKPSIDTKMDNATALAAAGLK